MDGNATFLVHVVDCQNATWQGIITWLEEKEKQRFRSALEMIKLMDMAIDGDRCAEAASGSAADRKAFGSAADLKASGSAADLKTSGSAADPKASGSATAPKASQKTRE